MESAPATIPAAGDVTFSPAFEPLSVGTVRRVAASSASPADRDNAITGTSPAEDTRFGSPKTAGVARDVWRSCTYEMPFVMVEIGP